MALLAFGCRSPATSGQGEGETAPDTDAAPSSHHRDAGPSSTLAQPDTDAQAHTREVPSRDGGGGTHDAESPVGVDASHEPSTILDARVPSLLDANTVASDAAATCNVDACNNAGMCIRRDWWTECSCDAVALPNCDYPRFRAIGPSRTDQEHALYLLSGDGHVVTGSHAFDAGAPTYAAVTWTAEAGLRALEQHPAGPAVPTKINADGSIIEGKVELGRGETLDVVWRDGLLGSVSADAGAPSAPDGPVRIPPDGTALTRYFEVFDATSDGRLVVGRTRPSNESARTEAAFWTPSDGVRLLLEYLKERGVEMNGWDLWHVNAVSDDGQTMLGLGIGPDVGYRWYLQLADPQR